MLSDELRALLEADRIERESGTRSRCNRLNLVDWLTQHSLKILEGLEALERKEDDRYEQRTRD